MLTPLYFWMTLSYYQHNLNLKHLVILMQINQMGVEMISCLGATNNLLHSKIQPQCDFPTITNPNHMPYVTHPSSLPQGS